MSRAFIIGISGQVLTSEEKMFIAATRPWGLILFARNISDKDQVKAVVSEFRRTVGDANAPVLIDQEGGRVQRLRPPIAPNYPSAGALSTVYEKDNKKGERAAYLTGRLIADDLHELGINVDCDPVLDLKIEGAHQIIGDRAYGTTGQQIIRLAKSKMAGLMDGAVLPVIKHMPGHGRALADSHLELPVVHTSHAELSKTDFVPFRECWTAAFAMTAHVVYADIDADHCATHSAKVIKDIIRGELSYDGALMSDDLGMKALKGDFGDRAKRALDAGCDLILHCSGDMAEMQAIAPAVPPLTGDRLRRCKAAMAQLKKPVAFDRKAAEQELQNLLTEAGCAPAFETLVA